MAGNRAPATEIVGDVPGDSGCDQRRQHRHLFACAAGTAMQDEQPDHGQHQIEDDLDAKRPGRGVDHQQRVGRVVLGEAEKQRQLAVLNGAPPRNVTRGGDQRERSPKAR